MSCGHWSCQTSHLDNGKPQLEALSQEKEGGHHGDLTLLQVPEGHLTVVFVNPNPLGHNEINNGFVKFVIIAISSIIHAALCVFKSCSALMCYQHAIKRKMALYAY